MNIKRILISEQEKKSILGLYNVISEQTSTNSYFLGPNQSVKFTVINGKETSDGKELTVNLGLIADFIVNYQNDKMGGIEKDVYSKLTGKLIYNTVNGMVRLDIDKPESIDNKSYEIIRKSFGDLVGELVTTGVSIDNAEYFQDEVLVTRLKNIKSSTNNKQVVNGKQIPKGKCEFVKIAPTNEQLCYLSGDTKYVYAKKDGEYYTSRITDKKRWCKLSLPTWKTAVDKLNASGCKKKEEISLLVPHTDNDTMAPPTANNVNSQPVDKQQSQPNITNNNLAVTNKPLDTEIGI